MWWPVPDDLYHYTAQFRDVWTGACMAAWRTEDGHWHVYDSKTPEFTMDHESFKHRYVVIFPPMQQHHHTPKRANNAQEWRAWLMRVLPGYKDEEACGTLSQMAEGYNMAIDDCFARLLREARIDRETA